MLNKLQHKVFGHPPTENTTAFIAGLSWSLFGTLVSSPVLLVISISLGRFLGPEGYGYYSIVITIANILAVLANFSFDQAAIKLSSENPESKESSKYFINSYLATFAISILLGLILLIFAHPLSKLLGGVPLVVFVLAFAYGLAIAIRQTTDAYIRSLRLFKYQSLIKIVETAVLTTLFAVVFLVLKHKSYDNYLILLIASAIVTISCFLFRIRKYISLSWNKDVLTKTWRYAQIGGAVSILGFVALNLDRFFLKANVGATELGIYTAYMLVPTNLASIIATAISNVFFPTMSAVANKQAVLRRVNRLFALAFLPITAIFFGCGYIALLLFGASYKIEAGNLTLASAYGAILVYLALLSAIIASSTKMYRTYMFLLPVKLALVTAMYLVFSKLFGLSIALVLVIAISNLIVDAALFNFSLRATKPSEY